jgi:multiple sugar transport system ATP-binding protein
VAGFIGSPAMNFLPGELDGDILHLPIGDVPINAEMRGRLQSGPGGGRSSVFVGIRPEHFQDAALVGSGHQGVTFKAKIDVLESLGSEYYAYFNVESEGVSSKELEELAQDTGAADIGQSREGTQIVARLDADTKIQQGAEAELWFDQAHLHLFDSESGESLLAARDGGAPEPQPPAPPQG